MSLDFWSRRPKWEGGEYEGDEEPRFEALMLAMELGAEYVDIELKVCFAPHPFHLLRHRVTRG